MAYAMIADEIGGPEVLVRRDIEMPTPGEGEIVVAHSAVGLNFIDIYFRTGVYPAPGGFPAVLGSEGAGVVEAVGSGVTSCKQGDRVAYTTAGGCYSSHRAIAADRVVAIPDGVSDEQAAGVMLKGLTAHYLIHDSYPVQAGDTVLFHAASGGVGSIAGQWLKAKGVTAIGTAGSAEKCALALTNGYAHAINYTQENFVQRVMEITGGAGVAAVYDSVGQATYPASLEVIRKFGTFVSFGQSSGVVTGFKLADLAAYGGLFTNRPTLFPYIEERDELVRRAGELFDAIADGTIKIAVNQTFALEDVADAHRALAGRQTTGQTVLLP